MPILAFIMDVYLCLKFGCQHGAVHRRLRMLELLHYGIRARAPQFYDEASSMGQNPLPLVYHH